MRPGIAIARLLTIAVVVAAASAVFAVANATILPPLPFPEPHRLVRVYFQPPGTTAFADADSLDALAFVRFREWTKTFDGFVGIFAMERGVTGDREPESIRSGQVTAGFFNLLGARVVLGRTFTDTEFANGDKAVVLSYGLWLRRFGGNAAIIGSALTIDREPHTIVGVVGPEFEPGFAPSEFWTPLDLRQPNAYFSGVQTIGRLPKGTTPEQAAAELNSLMPQLALEAPSAYKGWKMGTRELKEARYGARRPTILMLLAAVAALALIAVFNLVNLTLADVASRQSEMALRAALGGSRARIVESELVPGIVIAFVGCALGLLAVRGMAPGVVALDPSGLLGGHALIVDWRVIAIALVTAAGVITAAIAVPMIRVTRMNLAPEIAIGSRRTVGHSARRFRSIMVGAQVAVSIALIAAGALVVTTFQHAARIDAGFDPTHVITAQIRLSEIALRTPEARLAFVERIVARLRETPGVLAASTTLNSFVAGQGGARSLAFVEDRPNSDGSPYAIQSRRITPGYFDTMRIRMLHGRDFADTDRLGTQPVAIVSKSFADRFWPGQDALNRRVKRGVTTKDWSIVIGVADDVRDISLDQEPRDTLYTPFLQSPPSPLPVSLVVRTARATQDVLPAIKAAIWKIDPDQPLANVVTLEEFLRDSLGVQRFRALLVSAFAGVGLLLATLGAYAVTARAVVERRREAGVRLALGGEPRRVWLVIVVPVLRAVTCGALAGVALAWGARALLVWLIPETAAAGWGGDAFAATVLVTTGAIATALAARRILTLDPVKALEDR